MLERLVGKRRLSGLALALALGGSGFVSCGSEPVKNPPGMRIVDSDGDGMPDEMERRMGTNPLNRDSDNDGLDDLYEVQHGTDPMNPDDPPKNSPDAGSLDAMVEEYDSGRHPDAHISDNGYDAETPDAGFQDSGERDAGASMYPICRIGGPYEVSVGQILRFDMNALGSEDPDGMASYRVDWGDGVENFNPANFGRFLHSYNQQGQYTIIGECTNNRDQVNTTNTTVTVH